jgi:hypothetical protein
MAKCQGCGGELPPQKRASGRRRKWCSERCRRDTLYAGTCDTCGGPTDGSDGASRAPTRCADCIAWTPEAILEALRDWGDDHGIPPREVDTRTGHEGHGRLPHFGTVSHHFGSWNAALLAAGFEALHGDRRPETQAAIEAAIRAGEHPQDVADRYGVTVQAIYARFRVRGLRLQDLRP